MRINRISSSKRLILLFQERILTLSFPRKEIRSFSNDGTSFFLGGGEQLKVGKAEEMLVVTHPSKSNLLMDLGHGWNDEPPTTERFSL